MASGFESAKRRVVLESQQAMVAALKDERFEDALEAAERVLAVEPDNAVTLQFHALLEEKVAMDDDDDGGEGEEEVEGGESEGEESDSDASEEEVEQGGQVDGSEAVNGAGVDENTDDDEEDEEDEVEQIEYPDEIVSKPARNMRMSSEDRKLMRAQLRMEVEDLKLELQRQRLSGGVKAPATPPR
mmetsp:Transcript_36991/g.104417  ORF Transcript_36991/g.104417 Transcript_36991/m.104417 type:complete len:186 (-) Transcript_36991:45-602(-)